MDIFGDIERFLSEDVYPYRWPLTLGLLLAGIAGVAVALRLGWHRALWRHRGVTLALGVPALVVVVAAGWYLLSPLWERTHLEEASPLEAAGMPMEQASPVSSPASGTDAPSPTAPAFVARATHEGMFTGADDFHFGRGTAQLIETAPGVYTLRFEGFSVRNGPDLFVYLTPDAGGESIEGAINLGGLKATDGAFNYEVPPGTDVSQFASAIVWCRQFATLFAVAELLPV
jgi:hypothetical protein